MGWSKTPNEASQARVGKNGEAYNTLKARLDAENERVTTQLAQSRAEWYRGASKTAIKTNNIKASLVLQDDDGRSQLYTLLYPYIASKNIKLSSAIVSSRIGTDADTITIAQFKEMLASGVVEYCNHTHTHVDLASLTPAQIHDEIKKCEQFLESYGVFTKHLVYPFGGINQTVKEIATQYVNSASKANGTIINPTVVNDSYFMTRVVFETETSTIKSLLNTVKNQNGLMIINIHCHYPTFSISKLDEIVEYALANDIEIITMSEAHQRFSNVLEVRDGSGLIGGVSANGNPQGSLKANDVVVIGSATGLLYSDDISKYQAGKVTYTNINAANASANGWVYGACNVETVRTGNDDYAYQRIRPIRQNSVYTRYWDSSVGTWSEDDSPIVYTRSTPTVLAANGAQGFTVNNAKIKVGSALLVNPTFNIPAEIMYKAMITKNGTAVITVYNASQIERTVDAGDWLIKVIT